MSRTIEGVRLRLQLGAISMEDARWLIAEIERLQAERDELRLSVMAHCPGSAWPKEWGPKPPEVTS